VRVPRRARYVGGERFELYRVADCELHIFVEADAQRRVRRLYWVQFEEYLPRLPRMRYDYAKTGDRRVQREGEYVWLKVVPRPDGMPPRPGSDTEHVRRMLERNGYLLAADAPMVRMVRILDDPMGTGQGRRELMLIYAEAPSENSAAPNSVELAARAEASFSLRKRATVGVPTARQR
jgi:hypothetical protein